MHSNRFSYNMYPLSSEQQTDIGDQKFRPSNEPTGGGGDYTRGRILSPNRRGSKDTVFADEPTFSEDPAKWNRADYRYNIHFLEKYMINQKNYLKQEEDNFARNKELLANMKSAQQSANDECIGKESEIQQLKYEITEYKSQIRNKSDALASCKSQFLCEEEKNRDLKVQKRRLTKRREMQLRKQIEEGISDDIIEAYELAKQQLESEQERKTRLLKKDNWYVAEIATIREVLAQEENNDKSEDIEIEKVRLDAEQCDSSSYNNATDFLPKINKARTFVVSPEPPVTRFQEQDARSQRQIEFGRTQCLPPLSNASGKLLYQQKVAPELENVQNFPKIKVNQEHVPHSVVAACGYVPRPQTMVTADGFVPRSSTATTINGYVPRPPTAATTAGYVHRQPPASISDGYVPRPPTAAITDGHVPRPPTAASTDGYASRPPTAVTTDGYVPRPPIAATTNGYVRRPPTAAITDGHVPRPPTAAVTDGHVPRPPKAATTNGYVPRAPTAAVTDGHVPRPPTAATTDGYVPLPFVVTQGYFAQPPSPAVVHGNVPCSSTVSAMYENATCTQKLPHSQTDASTREYNPRPPSGKKDGSFRRFHRKFKNVIK